MKESLVMSLCLKIWDAFRLVLIVLGSTTLHQDLNIFLPGALSHLLLVSTTGRWMWQAVATGPLDFVMTPGQGKVTWPLIPREFFYFFVSKKTVSTVSLPHPHCYLNMSKSLWARWGCSWIMMVESWAFSMWPIVPSFVVSSTAPSHHHSNYFFALDTHDQRSKLWPQVSQMWIIKVVR